LLAGGMARQNTNADTWENFSARLDNIEECLDSLPEVKNELAELKRESKRTASTTTQIEKNTNALKKKIESGLAFADENSASKVTPNRNTWRKALGSDDAINGEIETIEREIGNLGKMVVRAFDPKTMEKNFYERLQKKLDLTEGQILDMKDLYKERGEKMRAVWKQKDSDEYDESNSFGFGFTAEKRKKLKEIEKWFKEEAQQVLNANQYEKMKKDPMLSHGPPSAGGGFNVITWSSDSVKKDEDK